MGISASESLSALTGSEIFLELLRRDSSVNNYFEEASGKSWLIMSRTAMNCQLKLGIKMTSP